MRIYWYLLVAHYRKSALSFKDDSVKERVHILLYPIRTQTEACRTGISDVLCQSIK